MLPGLLPALLPTGGPAEIQGLATVILSANSANAALSAATASSVITAPLAVVVNT